MGSASEKGWSWLENIFSTPRTRDEKTGTMVGTTKTVVKVVKTMVGTTKTVVKLTKTIVETTNTMVKMAKTMVKIDRYWKVFVRNNLIIVSDHGI